MIGVLTKKILLFRLMWDIGTRIGSIKNSGIKTAIVGIVLGATILSATLTVVRGYENTLRAQLLRLGPHIELSAYYGMIEDWQMLVVELEEYTEIISATPFFSYGAVIRTSNGLRPLQLRAEPEQSKTNLSVAPYLLNQSSALGTQGIFLGVDLATELGISIGDNVELLIAVANKSGKTRPVRRKLKLTGLFDSGTYLDQGLGIISYEYARRLGHVLPNEVGALDIKLDKPLDVRSTHERLRTHFQPRGFKLTSWKDQHSALFATVALSRRMLAVLMLAIMAIAAFNVAGTLLIAIEQRRYELARLLMMGAKPSLLVMVMLIRGVFLGVVGGLLGLSIGIGLALLLNPSIEWLTRYYNLEIFDTGVYYLDHLPATADFADASMVLISATLICLCASIYPASRVSKLRPVHAMANRERF